MGMIPNVLQRFWLPPAGTPSVSQQLSIVMKEVQEPASPRLCPQQPIWSSSYGPPELTWRMKSIREKVRQSYSKGLVQRLCSFAPDELNATIIVAERELCTLSIRILLQMMMKGSQRAPPTSRSVDEAEGTSNTQSKTNCHHFPPSASLANVGFSQLEDG